MSRRFVAAAWITGTTLPLLAAAVFLFACCVLPFHDTIHQNPQADRALAS